jgi:hypothetical protein
MKAPFLHYTEDEPIRAIGRRLLDCSLPKAEWTHQAHLVATLYLLRERPEVDVDLALPGIIWRYNEASGTANTDSGGYHETITRFYLRALKSFLGRTTTGAPLHRLNERLLASRFGAHELPLDYYTRERLFSVQARRVWVEPDRARFDFAAIPMPSGG